MDDERHEGTWGPAKTLRTGPKVTTITVDCDGGRGDMKWETENRQRVRDEHQARLRLVGLVGS